MTKAIFLVFGVACYVIFFATFLYLIAFVGDVPLVPLTVDGGGIDSPPPVAGAIDAGLIALFGVQHSLMARRGFKQAWRRIVPAAVERSAYVLFASAALIVLFLCWRPIGGTIWAVGGPARILIWAVFALGWLIVLLSTFLISHFELFGLSQVWNHIAGRGATAPVFRQPFFYRLVRHPLYVGFFLAFWATPDMTRGHLLLAAGMSAFMLIAIQLEERDLVRLFGSDYERYRTTTGMLVPRVGRARRAG